MTDNSLFLMGFCLLIIILLADRILNNAAWLEDGVTPQPIRLKYPAKDATMFETYSRLVNEIDAATDSKTMENIWVDIIIFNGSYKDSAIVYNHLMLQYDVKSRLLTSLAC